MNEHAVPRNVTGFQFQLIGSMTLKQFGYLLFGCVMAFIFFKSPLSIFRYPIAAFFALAGVAFAFLPVQERPLEVFLINLIKSVYAPTQFVWQKQITLPDIFTQQTTAKKQSQLVKTQANHQDTSAKLATYLASIKSGTTPNLEMSED